MFRSVKCSVLAMVTTFFSFPTDAARCTFKEFEYMNYTAFCYADQAIPDYFPPNLTSLFLNIPSGNENDSFPDCTTRSEPFTYLPAGKMPISGVPDLKLMSFCNFNLNDGRAERIGPYLEHVKSTLQTLQIVYGKLTRLEAGILRGFTNLKELEIIYTGLEDIEPGAFSEVTLDGPALVTGYLSLGGNRLKTFDWGLLKPMASGLENILLIGNAMESMHMSQPVFFPKLIGVHLNTNNLRTISAAVMNSFPRNLFDLNVLGNPFCPTDSLCRCCSLRSLWEYALNQSIHLAMSCGPDYKDEFECPVAGNVTLKSKSTCSAGCNTVLPETIDLAQYESCTANADPHAMACNTKRPAKNPKGWLKKQHGAKRTALFN